MADVKREPEAEVEGEGEEEEMIDVADTAAVEAVEFEVDKDGRIQDLAHEGGGIYLSRRLADDELTGWDLDLEQDTEEGGERLVNAYVNEGTCAVVSAEAGRIVDADDEDALKEEPVEESETEDETGDEEEPEEDEEDLDAIEIWAQIDVYGELTLQTEGDHQVKVIRLTSGEWTIEVEGMGGVNIEPHTWADIYLKLCPVPKEEDEEDGGGDASEPEKKDEPEPEKKDEPEPEKKDEGEGGDEAEGESEAEAEGEGEGEGGEAGAEGEGEGYSDGEAGPSEPPPRREPLAMPATAPQDKRGWRKCVKCDKTKMLEAGEDTCKQCQDEAKPEDDEDVDDGDEDEEDEDE